MSTPPVKPSLTVTESQARAPSAGDATAPPAPPDETVAQAGPSPAALAAGAAVQVPGYEVLGELGRGGMGVVYKARNVLMDRPEVLKVVNKALLDRPGVAERFLREVRAAARLSHENVVRAYSAVQVGDLLVFAMEYVEGEDLARLVKRQGPLPVAQGCDYVSQAALGLQHAHEHQMVHRDIKPHNLILSFHEKGPVVKVLDFGLAKAAREGETATDLTAEGAMLGTPAYMAPEQARDAAGADVRADIYSLGCTLYFLLAGAPPFSGKTHFAVLQAHLSTEATPLNQLRAEAPAALAAAAAKMMAKDPANRYQTPIDVARALAPFVQADPSATQAGPPVPAARPVAEKGPKRWRIAVVVVGGVLLSAMVAIGLWAGGVFRGKAPEDHPAADRTTFLPPAGSVPADKPAGPQGPPRPAEPRRADAPFDATAAGRLQQAWSHYLGMPVVRNVDVGGGVAVKLVLIPPGTFLMGSPDSDEDANSDETQHKATIAKPFYLGTCPVTQDEYVRVTGLKNPSTFSKGGPNEKGVQGLPTAKFPVEEVSWDDAAAFCAALNQKDAKRPAGWTYALPTEAQWEYACRAGTTTAYFFGDDPKDLGDYGWCHDNSGNRTHEVGTRKPNPWGLYDMAGNVYQWCQDPYGQYVAEDVNGPQIGDYAGPRVTRGGSWASNPKFCRAAYRARNAPAFHGDLTGCRVALCPD